MAGPVPLRCPAAERAAKGKKAIDETYRRFAQEVRQDIHPRDSWRASRAFREHISQVLARRAIEEAVDRAGGEAL